MKRFFRLALVAAAGILSVYDAYAAPVFQMRVRSGAYDSGIISGAIDPSQTSGSISLSGLVAAGGGGNAFNVGAIDADFDLGSPLTLNLSGSGIEHAASAAGSIRIFLTLAGLDAPASPVTFVDSFAGTFASAQAANRALLRVHLGDDAFTTQQSLFDTGSIRPNNAGANCTLPTAASYACDMSDPAVSPAFNPFAITELVQLNFAGNTLGASVNFSNRLADPIPEPGSLALILSGLLAAAGFRVRARRV